MTEDPKALHALLNQKLLRDNRELFAEEKIVGVAVVVFRQVPTGVLGVTMGVCYDGADEEQLLELARLQLETTLASRVKPADATLQ